MQNPAGPTIGVGSELTVTITDLLQDVTGNVYETMVVPTEMLVTSPVGSIVATPGAELAHVPPVLAVDNKVVAPIHTAGFPVNAAGCALTVTVAERTHPVPII